MDFKRKESNPQGDEKVRTFCKQIFASHPETMRLRGESNKQILLGSSLSVTFSLYSTKVIAPFSEQVFLFEFLKAGKEGGKRLFLSLLLLNN